MADAVVQLSTTNGIREWHRNIEQLRKMTGQYLETTMRMEGNMLAKAIIARTPPFSSRVRTPGAAKKVGEKKVAREINYVFRTPTVKRGNKYVVDNRTKAQRNLNNNPIHDSWMDFWHKKHRKKGVIKRALPHRKKQIVGSRQLKRYIREKQENVGYLISGWRKALEKWPRGDGSGGVGTVRGLPAFARRHSAGSEARLVVNEATGMLLSMTNAGGFASDNAALKRRIKSALMERNHKLGRKINLMKANPHWAKRA